MAAAKLRRRIQREMRATRAREQIGFRDDQAVTRACEREKACLVSLIGQIES
jgi:hypothetical protein